MHSSWPVDARPVRMGQDSNGSNRLSRTGDEEGIALVRPAQPGAERARHQPEHGRSTGDWRGSNRVPRGLRVDGYPAAPEEIFDGARTALDATVNDPDVRHVELSRRIADGRVA